MERPKFHFTPLKGWINDPNGTIYIDGKYHLFYQHYPDGLTWGPMHWGHAVSEDLTRWEHKDIALYPDEDGYIFSGSCVYDRENVSGFGKDGKCPIIAFYTSHNPETSEQKQCIAYSLDFEHFEKYEGNPVIENSKGSSDYKVDFRDPKVFENPVKGGFSMVISAGRKLEFYHSLDLKEWKCTGEFDPSVNGFYGIYECPDCFPMLAECGTKWILTMSTIVEDDKVGYSLKNKEYDGAHVMQYFIGEFNGATFIDTEEYADPLILDYGPDNYAMTSFSESPWPLMIGWGEHWDYAAEVPASSYRGKMTMARRLLLDKTDAGYRLSQKPHFTSEGENAPKIASYNMLPGEKLHLNNIEIIIEENEIIVDRSVGASNVGYDFCDKIKQKKYNVFSAKRYKKGICNIMVTCDAGFYEIYAENGLIVFSCMTF